MQLYSDLNLLDNQTASLLLFEQATRLKSPFTSQPEANTRLRLFLLALSEFEVQTDRHKNFLSEVGDWLNKSIYESEEFDEHLGVKEYIILREITIKMGDSGVMESGKS